MFATKLMHNQNLITNDILANNPKNKNKRNSISIITRNLFPLKPESQELH